MGTTITNLNEYVAEQVAKYEGSLVPVKVPLLWRLLVKSVSIKKLHPNPDDEFCFPSIGPNYSIISNYEEQFRRLGIKTVMLKTDPIQVEKVRPDGYMILNGHHRWAAALRMGISRIPVHIVNLTMETDIRKMLKASDHDKRVTLDLDEVVFVTDSDMPAEKPLPVYFRRVFRERVRKGLPALMHYLSMEGYDIWVYTSGYYSYDYIYEYFKRYSVMVDGVITGTGRRRKGMVELRKSAQELFNAKYNETIHIGNDMVLRTFTGSDRYEKYILEDQGSKWAQKVLKIIKGFEEEQSTADPNRSI